jgi:hypothetical protein
VTSLIGARAIRERFAAMRLRFRAAASGIMSRVTRAQVRPSASLASPHTSRLLSR